MMTRREKRYHARKKQVPFAVRVLSENIQKEIDNEILRMMIAAAKGEEIAPLLFKHA
jgi:hypothetical protein